jgi:hypothetical protein
MGWGPTVRYQVKISFDGMSPLTLILNTTEETWLIAKPYPADWRRMVGGIAGKLEYNMGNQIQIYDGFGRRRIQLNSFSWQPGQEPTAGARGTGAWALNLDNTNPLNYTQGGWLVQGRPLPQGKSTGIWVGVAGKGSIGAGLSTEAAVAAVWSLDDPKKGMEMIVSSTRVGVVAGGSIGVSVCIVTGVQNKTELENYACSGTDWTVAIGGPVKAAATLTKDFANFFKAAKVAKYAQYVEYCAEHADAVVNLGKTLLINSNIDPESTSVSFLDLPGPGIELGWFWYWAAVRYSNDFKYVPVLGHRSAQVPKKAPAHPQRIHPFGKPMGIRG